MTKDLKECMDYTLGIIKVLSVDNYDRLKLEFAKLSDKELTVILTNPVDIYLQQFEEPTGVTMDKIIKKEKIIISEHVDMGYLHKIEVDGETFPVRSARTNTILPCYIRKAQQISTIESKTASGSEVDIIGQDVNGKGTLSVPEQSVLLSRSNSAGSVVLKELMGAGSGTVAAKEEYNKQLRLTGSVKLADLPETDSNSGLQLMDQILKEGGIDNDLVSAT